MKKLYTLLMAVVITASVFAQSPNKMSYQAVVRDASNVLVASSSVGMQISILQGSSSGTAVYVEKQTPTTNANGLASIEIGSGTVISGTFAAIDWVNGPYFIKTETDPTGGTTYTITGTSELLSVPYALHAKTVENESDTTHWKENGSNIYYTNGNVGIGTTNPAYKLSVNGNAIEISGVPTPGLLLNPSVSATKTGVVFQSSDQLIFGANGIANIGSIDLNAPAGSFAVGSNGNFNFYRPINVDSGGSVVFFNPTNTAWTTMRMNASNRLQNNYTVEVTNGEVYISDMTNSGNKGVITKSPNGNCWRITVDNSGNLVTTAITCP